jgi:hypothetical protein
MSLDLMLLVAVVPGLLIVIGLVVILRMILRDLYRLLGLDGPPCPGCGRRGPWHEEEYRVLPAQTCQKVADMPVRPSVFTSRWQFRVGGASESIRAQPLVSKKTVREIWSCSSCGHWDQYVYERDRTDFPAD